MVAEEHQVGSFFLDVTGEEFHIGIRFEINSNKKTSNCLWHIRDKLSISDFNQWLRYNIIIQWSNLWTKPKQSTYGLFFTCPWHICLTEIAPEVIRTVAPKSKLCGIAGGSIEARSTFTVVTWWSMNLNRKCYNMPCSFLLIRHTKSSEKRRLLAARVVSCLLGIFTAVIKRDKNSSILTLGLV